MQVRFTKQEGRNISNKGRLNGIRGTIILDSGMELDITPKQIRLRNFDVKELLCVGSFMHHKDAAYSSSRKEHYHARDVIHTIYVVDIFGVPMLFERIGEESSMRAYKPKRGQIKPDGNILVKHTFLEEDNVKFNTYIEEQLLCTANKPKHLKTQKKIEIKLSKLPYSMHFTYK